MNEKEKFLTGGFIAGILAGLIFKFTAGFIIHAHLYIWECIGGLLAFVSGMCWMGFIVKCDRTKRK